MEQIRVAVHGVSGRMGREVLSAALPSDADEIEALRREALSA